MILSLASALGLGLLIGIILCVLVMLGDLPKKCYYWKHLGFGVYAKRFQYGTKLKVYTDPRGQRVLSIGRFIFFWSPRGVPLSR